MLSGDSSVQPGALTAMLCEGPFQAVAAGVNLVCKASHSSRAGHGLMSECRARLPRPPQPARLTRAGPASAETGSSLQQSAVYVSDTTVLQRPHSRRCSTQLPLVFTGRDLGP